MIYRHHSCSSTNAVLSAMNEPPHGTTVVTHSQTAGRGQRGNSWEAQPGKNLTFSTLLRPASPWPTARQFEISMLVALVMAEATEKVLKTFVPDAKCTIKWPNDIYVDDRKICGILIENTLTGNGIVHSIAGIGLNVNQEEFLSDAPNPVSMIMLTGTEYPLNPLLEMLVGEISAATGNYFEQPDYEHLKLRFMNRLYRCDGRKHAFRLPDGTLISAAIIDVMQDGHLVLDNGSRYAFKEIAYVI